MTEKEFHVNLELRIDWSDLDYLGHVNNVSFFRYLQSSRVNYMDLLGLTQMHLQTNIGLILASCKCDFLKPLHYPGNITVLARVAYIRRTSFGLSHRILDDNGEIAAEALDVLVMFDFNRNEKIHVLPEVRENIGRIEQKTF